MNILVCVKQVPNTEEEKLRLDAAAGALVREGLSSAINDFDAYALEAAARVKDNAPETQIIVLTLGPAQAKAVVKEGLSVAADKAYQVTDDAFRGSDAGATSLILAAAIRSIEVTEGEIDAVFCGRQTIDGECAIVGAGIAEALGLPQVTGCVEAVAEDGCFVVDAEIKNGVKRIRVQTPCLLTFAKPAWKVRYSNIKRKMAANRAVIPVLSAAELTGLELSRVGMKGSQMKITGSYAPEVKKGAVMLTGETPEEAAAKLCQCLIEANAI